MPLGYLSPSGRPHGMSILSTVYKEPLILRIMDVYDRMSFIRKVPAQFDAFMRKENSHL